MLKAIVDFFRRLFGGGSKKSTPPPSISTGTTEVPKKKEEGIFEESDISDLPQVDITEPQDGSEITADTTVVMVNETPPEELEIPPVIV